MNDLASMIKQSLADNDYRHGYVDEFLNAYIATQIKVLREQRGWSQSELGERAGMKQSRISIIENVNYSSWSIKILRKIAEAFDLSLGVSFETFGKRMGDIENFSRGVLERNSFNNDPYFFEEEKIISDGKRYKEVIQQETSSKVVNINKNRETIPAIGSKQAVFPMDIAAYA